MVDVSLVTMWFMVNFFCNVVQTWVLGAVGLMTVGWHGNLGSLHLGSGALLYPCCSSRIACN